MDCPRCGREIPEDSKFCLQCGLNLTSPGSGAARHGTNDVDGAPTLPPTPARGGGDGEHAGPSPDIDGTPTVPRGHRAPGTSEPPARLVSGRFEVLELRGEGGMGRVYRARDRKFDVEVALKRLRMDIKESELGVKRFWREAAAIKRLNHQNIVRVEDVGEDDEGPYIAMEWVGGVDLAELTRREGKLELKAALELFRGICIAVWYAHQRSVIHRDIKPQNILLTEDGTPKLVDFGLARIGSESQLSQSGYGLGTLAYMAPEQRRDATQTDQRSDIFSLGKTFYHMVTGQVPDPVDPEALPKGVRDVVMRALKPRPEDRYYSVEAFLESMERAARTGRSGQVAVAQRVVGTCPYCSHVNPKGARFCESCGAGLFETCPHCGVEDRAGAEYCKKCGVHIAQYKEYADHLSVAKEHLKGCRYSRAVKEADLALALQPGDAEAVALREKAEEKRVQLEQLREESHAATGAGDFEKAEALIRRGLKLSPADEGLTAELADLPNRERAWKVSRLKEELQTLLDGRRGRAALGVTDEILSLEPGDGEALAAKVELEERIRGVEERVARASALVRRGEFEEATRVLCGVLDEAVDEEEAQDLAEQVAEVEPRVAQLRKELDEAGGRHEYSDVVRLCGELQKLTPDAEWVEPKRKEAERLQGAFERRVAEARVSLKAGQHKEAIEACRALLEERPADRDALGVRKGALERKTAEASTLIRRGEFDEGERMLREVLEVSPAEEEAKSSLEQLGSLRKKVEKLRDAAEASRRRNEYREVVRLCGELRKLAPDAKWVKERRDEAQRLQEAFEARLGVARESLRSHEYEEALRTCEVLLKERSEDADVRALREEVLEERSEVERHVAEADVALKERRFDAALASAEWVLRTNPDEPRALSVSIEAHRGLEAAAARRRRLKRLTKALVAVSIAAGVLVIVARLDAANFRAAQQARVAGDPVEAAHKCMRVIGVGVMPERLRELRSGIAGDLSTDLTSLVHRDLYEAVSERSGLALRLAPGNAAAAAAQDTVIKILETQGSQAHGLGDYPAATEHFSRLRACLTLMGKSARPAETLLSAVERARENETRGLEYTLKHSSSHAFQDLQTAFDRLLAIEPGNRRISEYGRRIDELRPAGWKRVVSNIEFVWIPAGQFYMGSPENEAGRDSDEGPRHPVSIEHGFWLSAKEVTTAQYCSFLDVAGNGDAAGSPFVDMSEPDGPFRRSRGGFAVRDGWAGRPAPNVSWEGAVAFCSGMQGRLPSEAEWEYACRAGSDSPYTDNVSSPRDAGSYAWHWGNSDGKPSAVGLKRPNRWGLYDMHGNVWEWCSDWYAARYNAADRRNPAGPSSGTTHVMRGGSWLGEAEPCRSAARNDIETRSAAGLNCVGFRVALDSQWSRD